jgi:hypothetical protein
MTKITGDWPMNIIFTTDVPNMSRVEFFEDEDNDNKVTAIFDGKFFTGTIISEIGETQFIDGDLVNAIDYSTITKH